MGANQERLMKEFDFKTTKEIKVPNLIIDQIIGQDKAVKLLKKIAKQRRNLLLIGNPGVGKSLIAQVHELAWPYYD